MSGAGWATLLSTFLVALILVALISLDRSLRQQKVFSRLLDPDWAVLLDICRLGGTIGTTTVAEIALFTVASLLMGRLGPMELAAHGIALQLSSLAFMIPLGLAAAVTIRVGHACGQGDRQGMWRSAITAVALGIAVACFSALLFLTAPHLLISLYLDLDAEASKPVIPLAVSFLAVVGVFQIVDGLQAIAMGALRGIKDVYVPMVIALASYWSVGMPLGYWLAFNAGWGGVGIWWGLAAALASTAVLMILRCVAKSRAW